MGAISPQTGEYRLIETKYQIDAAIAAGMLVMHGTEPEIKAVSERIRLGNKVQENRKARRKAQRDSRKKNR